MDKHVYMLNLNMSSASREHIFTGRKIFLFFIFNTCKGLSSLKWGRFDDNKLYASYIENIGVSKIEQIFKVVHYFSSIKILEHNGQLLLR